MLDQHEPDPRFLDSLEGRISSELRNRSLPRRTRGRSNMPWVVLGSALFGAAVTGATFQAGDNWRAQLIETRLETELEVMNSRFEAREAAVAAGYRRAESGAVPRSAVAGLEALTHEARMSAELIESRLDEVRASGREPSDVITAPVVDRVDFVTERINIRLGRAIRAYDAARHAAAEASRQHEVGAMSRSEANQADFVAFQLGREVASLQSRRTLRRLYLDDGITAPVAELRDALIDVDRRTLTLSRQLVDLKWEADRSAERLRFGAITPEDAARVRAEVAEVEAKLELAQRESGIINEALGNIEPR